MGGPSRRRGRRARVDLALDPQQEQVLMHALTEAVGAASLRPDLRRDAADAIRCVGLQLLGHQPNSAENKERAMTTSQQDLSSDSSGTIPDPRLQSMLDGLRAISAGDLGHELTVSGTDDVAKLADEINRAVRAFRDTLQAAHQQANHMGSLTETLTSTAQELSVNADRTSGQAESVASSATQVHQNVQTVAAAAEEMAIGVRDIAKNASEAARVATGAVQMAQSTNETISKLGDSSTEIGKVIKVITSIAQQTNLLALNATIEAARAGEAGKGFAVVANEVKELAKETAKATEDISQKIETIQNDTGSAVAAIGEISNISNQINDYQSSIASAVEEQTATTHEISRSVQEAARGSESIASSVKAVAESVTGTKDGLVAANRSATGMAGSVRELTDSLNRFRS
jgi:methyl-accepting chemotaxis protein